MDYSQISGTKAPKYALLAVAALAAGLFFATPELKASADTVTTPVAIAPLTQVMDDGGGVYVGEIILRSDGFYYKVIAITSAYVEYQTNIIENTFTYITRIHEVRRW
ncbi:hypothetical protein [Lactococcus protaetiae]|uniref:Uncharacterized protein n=1 Tax=Lactococcus protaetiae TaxID=2592653 RepID=A0A514Z667_9LACT|nr:hypothetical protein [Lactococcus protaetiae]QDK70080.1 hypothetical protein FLP15_01445 [Lactococcus protaetiae]